MNRQTIYTGKHLLWACIPFLLLSFSMSVSAATLPKPGSYCPGKDILLVAAEELSVSLERVIHSRAALINKNQKMAISALTSAGTTMHLATSRGAAARTILLIDAIIEARTSEDYTQTLPWFSLLYTSLLTLPDDATVSAANDSVGRAESIMKGEKDGDPIKHLRDARHLLSCDDFDIPLQAAIDSQDKLMKQLGQNTKNNAYDPLVDSLRRALAYTLGTGEK